MFILEENVSGQKVLILSSKFGEGHYKAGEALVSAFEYQLPRKTRVKHLDFGSFFYKKTDSLMRMAYLNMVKKTPEIWRLIYEKTADLTAASSLKFVLGLNFKNLLAFIHEFRPDVIVNTHFIPAGILAEFKRKGVIDIPLATVVTDYLVHGVWIHSGIDLYLVGCREAYSRLLEAGIASDRIALTGIPVRAVFEDLLSKDHARNKLGLDPIRKTVLVMGGFKGFTGKDTDVFDHLLHL
jgi:processive 1,2-diacylglycerol beta-glucosyltransferase